MSINIQYDGEYPNLCSGKLIVSIHSPSGTAVWPFPDHCLSPGGGVGFTDDYDEILETGEWTVRYWPEGFPEDLKESTLSAINAQILWGHCGGCL